jgi:hypothetical protein
MERETEYIIFIKSRMAELKNKNPELKKTELMKMAAMDWKETPKVKNNKRFYDSIHAISVHMNEEKRICDEEIHGEYSNFEEWKGIFTTYTYYHLCVLINKGNIDDNMLQNMYDNDYIDYIRE